MKDSLTINPKLEQQLTDMLFSHGLSLEDIQEILKGGYQSFSSEEEVSLKLPSIFDNEKYTNIIQGLSDGYTLDEMSKELGINQEKISLFKNLLEQNNLSVDIVKAFNKYTIGSNMILAAKRGIERKDILQSITDEFNSRMSEYGFPQNQIEEIKNYVEGLDYSQPLHKNYKSTKEFLQKQELSNKYVAVVQTTVRNLDSYHHLDETLLCLDDGLLKNLPESIKLFRAIKGSYLESKLQQKDNLTSLIGSKIDEEGYSSTSLIYDTSFAKYDDYNIVFDIYAPKGTQGILVTPFSSYGNTEQEVLINSNDLYIIDVTTKIIDKNGRTKTICKALILSKDKSCYKGINKKQNTDLNEMSKEQLIQLRDEIKNNQTYNLDISPNKKHIN